MKIRMLLCLLAISCLAALSGTAKADGIPAGDPRIILAGAGASIPVGLTFTFTSDNFLQDDNPFIDFQNVSGVTFTNLVISVNNAAFPPDSDNPLTCEAQAFFTGCSVNADGTSINFFGLNGDNLTGIHPGVPSILYSCELNCNGFTGGDFQLVFIGWDPNTTFNFSGAANTVPEPTSFLFFLSGLVALAGYGLTRKQRNASLSKA